MPTSQSTCCQLFPRRVGPAPSSCHRGMQAAFSSFRSRTFLGTSGKPAVTEAKSSEELLAQLPGPQCLQSPVQECVQKPFYKTVITLLCLHKQSGQMQGDQVVSLTSTNSEEHAPGRMTACRPRFVDIQMQKMELGTFPRGNQRRTIHGLDLGFDVKAMMPQTGNLHAGPQPRAPGPAGPGAVVRPLADLTGNWGIHSCLPVSAETPVPEEPHAACSRLQRGIHHCCVPATSQPAGGHRSLRP